MSAVETIKLVDECLDSLRYDLGGDQSRGMAEIDTQKLRTFILHYMNVANGKYSQQPAPVSATEPECGIKRFTVYRKGDLSATHNEQQVNPPDVPQFEGVVFSDGTCVLRWCTPLRSTSVWASLDDALGVHGHFEERYGTHIVWHTDDATLRARLAEAERVTDRYEWLKSKLRVRIEQTARPDMKRPFLQFSGLTPALPPHLTNDSSVDDAIDAALTAARGGG